MRAVYEKETGQLFHSVIGYIYLSAFTLLSGCYFLTYNLFRGSGDIRDFFSPFMSTVIFLLPVLTMRTYAEERRARTDRLLLSAPVGAFSIAAGKFLAVFTMFAAGLACTLIYVLALALLGRFDPLTVLGCYAGTLASAAAFIAIGLFLSALTENQIIACIVTYAVLLGLWLVGFARSYLPFPWLRAAAGWLSAASRFAEFSMGIFDFSTVFYYLSIAAFFLYAVCVITRRRETA